MSRILYYYLYLFALLSAFPLFSGSTSQTFSVTLPYASTMDLSLSETTLNFSTPSESDMNAGYVDLPQAFNILLFSNAPWMLAVQTVEADLGGSAPKPISDLKGKLSTGSEFRSLSQNPTIIRNTNQRVNGLSLTADLRMVTGWTVDPPGTYAATLLFTLGSPP